jgi:aminoglycoside phosphotransferase (APT) family kinase protein
MSDVIVAPHTRDLDELAARLAGWLATRLPGARDIRVDNLAYPRGAGQSHETVLFDAHWTDAGAPQSQGCVVRIKPKGFTVFPDNLFDEQYEVMRVLHQDSDVRVARPLWIEQDPAILGNAFFVMEKKIGRVPVSVPPYSRTGWLSEATPDQRRHLWEGAVRQLAAIQLVPLGKVQFLAGPDHAREGLAQEWDKYVRFVAWLEETEPQPLLRKALARLEGLWPANQPEGMVWGDARIGNMMFDDNFDVVAVMDWEQPSLGGALHDLAWFTTLAETMHGASSQIGAPLAGMGTREETIALWQDICGKPVDDFAWYEDFTQLKMTCTGVRLGQLRGTRMFDEAWMAQRLKVAL